MSGALDFTAIVPVRHDSERVPGKNYRLFAGRPLFHYIVETLLSCRSISVVVVDTDSGTISEGIREAFPSVTVLDRPPHLRDGSISMNEVLLNVTRQVPSDYYLQTHTTNPLLRADTIDRAVAQFVQSREDHDSLFGVTRMHARFWTSTGTPLNHDPMVLLRTQDLPPVFLENSSMYLFDRTGFHERRNRIGSSPLLFEVAPDEAWDIDTELDFAIAEVLYRRGRV